MEKNFLEMSEEEFKAEYDAVRARLRLETLAIGQPYLRKEEGGGYLAEFPDGRFEHLETSAGYFCDEDEEQFVKKGKMKKDPFRMNKEELTAWKIQFNAEIRERLFAIGQPLVYEKDGVFIAEYADGSIKELNH